MRMYLVLFILVGNLAAQAKPAKTEIPKFSGMLSLSYQSPFDSVEGQDPMTLVMGGGMYNISREKSVMLTFRYFQQMISYATDDGTQGLMDTMVMYSDNSHDVGGTQAAGKDWGFNYGAGMILPTSDSSQKAGLYSGILGNFNLTYRYKRATFLLGNTLNYNFFEWDTADPSGYMPNEEIILRNTVAGRLNLNSKRTWSAGLQFIYSTMRNTATNFDNAYILMADVTGMWNRNIMTNLTIGGADRKHDTTNLFVYDRMFVMFGITVNI